MAADSNATRPPGGAAIPGFSLIALAGQGGMGTVYQAQQDSPRRIVALKLLNSASVTPEGLAAFRREAQVIAGLEHPHILPLYGFGEHGGQPYLVLRYLRGGSLADRLRGGPLDLPTTARWVRAAAAALDFAHQRGLVHRDVKPSNILLDESGNVYLTDFGIAGALAEAGSGAPTGSAAYMSPEQGRGLPVDHRADVYALAVTVFEMLTGQKPYTAETALGVIVRHIHDPIPSARALNPDLPPAVDDLLQRGMAKEPDERPQSAGEFAQLLDHAVAQPTAPLPAPTRPAAAAAPTAAHATEARTVGGTRIAGPTLSADALHTRPGATVAAQGSVGAAPASPAAARPRRGPAPAVWLAIGVLGMCVAGGVLLGGGTLAAGLFVGAATPTRPAPTATTSAATAAPATAAPSLAPPTPAGQLLADDFSVPGSGFATTSDPDDPDGGVRYAGGVLQFRVLTEGIEWKSPSRRVEAADVLVEVDVRQASGPERNEMAVLCRWQDEDRSTTADDYYTALAISGDGAYSIWQVRAGETERLVPWTPALTAGIGPETTYRVTVTCSGETLRLEVDGTLLAEVADPAPIAGDIALLAGLRAPGQLVVTFDNLVVHEP